MTKLAALVHRLPQYLGTAALLLWVGTFGFQNPASAREGRDLEKLLADLSKEDLNELFVFVAGNTLFTLYHESGHMLVSELGLPVLAQEEDAVDNLATVSMLAAGSEDMDLFLTNAMVGWFLIADENYDNLVFYDEHDLDQQRGYRMLCLMVGSDEEAFIDLALELGLPEERIETCSIDYEQVSASWEVTTDPFVRDSETPAGKIKIVYDPAQADLEPLALFLKESTLMELVAREIDTFYQLPEMITFRAKTCGMENAFWDPDTREVILCHELLAGFAELYLDSLAAED
ncbi:DUF4344 domain-containing metallopeptidase [Roseibium sp.]|uniref:DUF4344 domain-containing metallopeptidase n=1 Tax=Roseibium sp. TaxID=1936156 RepID=UPI003D0AD9E3